MGSIIKVIFFITHSVGQLKQGEAIEVALYKNHLSLSAPFVKPAITLEYSKITDVCYGIVTETVEKKKSVFGRAVAGGILFGDAGAVAGAMSGAGTKVETIYKRMFTISYKSSSGEDGTLTFEDMRIQKGENLAKKLKALCGIQDVEKSPPPPPPVITSL